MTGTGSAAFSFNNCKLVQIENLTIIDSVIEAGAAFISIKNALSVIIKGNIYLRNVTINKNSAFINI